MTSAWRRTYGANPLQLLALLGCFALSGWAALQVARAPLAVRTGLWFLAAVIAHDLVLFPLYALLDRSLGSLTHRIRHRPAPGSSVNYVRVPALLSGLLLLVFAPGILRRGGQAFGRASGLDQSPYLGRWLAITAVLFLGSAVVYAVRRGSRRSRSAAAAS